MDDQETNSSASKRPKLSHQDEPVKNEMVIAGPSNEQTSPKLFKLDIDCFDEIFEYLSLEDLDSFGQTCKAVHKLTGEYFKRNYQTARIRMKSFEPVLVIFGRKHSYSSSRFNQFVRSIEFNRWNPESLLYFSLHSNEFGAINNLSFFHTQLNKQTIETLSGIFPKVEIINFFDLDVKVNIYESMLKQCTNLRHLRMFDICYQPEPHHEILEPNSWMHQKYPKLELIGLREVSSINDLKTFFQNNPNVRKFITETNTIWTHRNELKNFNVQLDILKLYGKMRNPLSVPFCKLLNELYDIKFYKRLEMYWYYPDDHSTTDNDFSTNLASVHGLELCDIPHETGLRFLPDLPNLKTLTVKEGKSSLESKLISKQFANLQKLTLDDANEETINMFIQGLPKLKILKLNYCSQKNTFLKLQTLNMERQKVFEAQKVTIYVPDDVFLKTKWSTANGDTNLQMIEMKRIGSYKSSLRG